MKKFLWLLAFLNLPWMTIAGERDSINISNDITHTDTTQATISLQANVNGAKVFSDTMMLGVTPIVNQHIAVGSHILRILCPDSLNWLSPVVVETVTVYSTEHVERTITFPRIYYITSDPFGANVKYRDSVIGTTPLRLSVRHSISVINISKAGFKEIIAPMPEEGGELHIKLEPSQQILLKNSSKYLNDIQVKNPIPIYITTGSAIASGVAAAYLKIKADKYYQEYQRTNNNVTLNRVRRLDIVSGISLAVCEISIFTLYYLFLSE